MEQSVREVVKKKKQLPYDEVSLFCEQAGLILKSGVPVVEGLEAILDEEGASADQSYKALLETIGGREQLSDGLEAAGVFPAYMIKLIKIGEVTGKLEEVMMALATYYRRESDIRKALKSAVLYPAMLILVMAAVVVILVTQVMPIFNRVFASLGAEMDGSMTNIVNVGTTLGTVVIVALGIALICLIIFGILYKVKGADFGNALAGKVFHPIGRLFETISKARFAAAMALMQMAGLPMEQALGLAQELPFDAVTKEKIGECVKKMTEEGLDTAQAIAQAKIYDPIYLKIIKAGYQAGQIDTAMERVAQIYEEKTDVDIRSLVGLIEPTLVVVLAVAIGSILLSVMLPLAGMMTTIL
jgi:Type II secretory pathway, component PulF